MCLFNIILSTTVSVLDLMDAILIFTRSLLFTSSRVFMNSIGAEFFKLKDALSGVLLWFAFRDLWKEMG